MRSKSRRTQARSADERADEQQTIATEARSLRGGGIHGGFQAELLVSSWSKIPMDHNCGPNSSPAKVWVGEVMSSLS